jgi:hypothetical protein
MVYREGGRKGREGGRKRGREGAPEEEVLNDWKLPQDFSLVQTKHTAINLRREGGRGGGEGGREGGIQGGIEGRRERGREGKGDEYFRGREGQNECEVHG